MSEVALVNETPTVEWRNWESSLAERRNACGMGPNIIHTYRDANVATVFVPTVLVTAGDWFELSRPCFDGILI
jgi:hypothetical protein